MELVKEIDGKALAEITASYKDVVQKARNNRLSPSGQYMQFGT